MSLISDTYIGFEDMYEDNRRLVYTFIYDHLNDEDLVSEIYQFLWVKVYENYSRFENKEKKEVKNYLRVMTRNLVNDHFRRVKKERKAYEDFMYIVKDDMSKGDSIEKELFSDDLFECLEEAKNILSDEEKDLLMLRYGYNMQSRDMAGIYGVSDQVIRTRLMRIRKKLKDRINSIIAERNGENDEKNGF